MCGDGWGLAECLQDKAGIVWCDAPLSQLDEQSRQPWSQIDEEANETAGFGQHNSLLQQRQRRLFVSLGITEQSLQGQHLDGETDVVGASDESVQSRQHLAGLPSAGGRILRQQDLWQRHLWCIEIRH